jgi:hypothetical protein
MSMNPRKKRRTPYLLRPNLPARMVLDLDFSRPKAADAAEGRDHPVHLAVERELAHDTGPVALEAAVMIV